jgi:hypothetical protein
MATETQQDQMMAKPQKQHDWLHRFVGEWTCEAESIMGPNEPPVKTSGTESVRSIGGLWIMAEGQGECPGTNEPATTILTLGYDVQKQQYVGSFIASMMTYLWIYRDGRLDADQRTLTLNTEGPAMDGSDRLIQYRDTIEFRSDDHRVMTSHMLGEDGQWVKIMEANYRRKR